MLFRSTYFLPDREREEAERTEREELRKKWLQMQEDMKLEDIEIVRPLSLASREDS